MNDKCDLFSAPETFHREFNPPAPETVNPVQGMPNWKMSTHNGLQVIARSFQFHNFRQSLDFANRLGNLAEEEGQHPAILVEWNKVTVSWWLTHHGGIRVQDFSMASKTEWLAETLQPSE